MPNLYNDWCCCLLYHYYFSGIVIAPVHNIAPAGTKGPCFRYDCKRQHAQRKHYAPVQDEVRDGNEPLCIASANGEKQMGCGQQIWCNESKVSVTTKLYWGSLDWSELPQKSFQVNPQHCNQSGLKQTQYEWISFCGATV